MDDPVLETTARRVVCGPMTGLACGLLLIGLSGCGGVVDDAEDGAPGVGAAATGREPTSAGRPLNVGDGGDHASDSAVAFPSTPSSARSATNGGPSTHGVGVAVAEGTPDGPVVLCLGDSLTAGYGLDPNDAWPALVQRRVDQAGWPFRVINAGSSGETTTGGLRSLDWALGQHDHVAAVIVALGGNDGLRGISVELMESNLEAIITRLRDRRPDAAIVLTGMQSPPNMGSAYTSAFRDVFPRVAERHGVALVPFLLEGVGGEPDFNQRDGIHPNVEGQRRVAENVWAELEPLLAERVQR